MQQPHDPATSLIGSSVRRREDPRLVTGAGSFVGDVDVPGILEMAVLRSPYPHARITAIDTTAARAMPGVHLILTGADLEEHLDLKAQPIVPGMRIPPHPILARRVVHTVGVPRVGDIPDVVLGETITPNPFHPLGVEGVGEAGTNGAPAAIANAVMDALAPLGITQMDMPYTAPISA